jgi:hypothetical protein
MVTDTTRGDCRGGFNCDAHKSGVEDCSALDAQQTRAIRARTACRPQSQSMKMLLLGAGSEIRKGGSGYTGSLFGVSVDGSSHIPARSYWDRKISAVRAGGGARDHVRPAAQAQ